MDEEWEDEEWKDEEWEGEEWEGEVVYRYPTFSRNMSFL